MVTPDGALVLAYVLGVWNFRRKGFSVKLRGFRKQCWCLIRISEVFLKWPTVSVKDLLCWGFNDVGPQLRVGLSDNCHSPISCILVLYLNQFSCAEAKEILCVFIMLFFLP